MEHQQESGMEKFNRVVIPKITALGAAVVIIGALFKIEHYPGAGIMLIIGLGTEAFVFFLGVFQVTPPPERYYDWAKVYPELEEESTFPSSRGSGKKSLAAMANIDKILAESDLSTESLKNFGQGISRLNNSVTQIKDLTDVSSASNEYTKNLRSATGSINKLTQSFDSASGSMKSISEIGKGAAEYHSQVQIVTKNLGALNAVYDMELKDANNHLKAMNKFYGSLVSAMESMSDASKESSLFKDQVAKLTDNLGTLNNVYGNMISAMKNI